MSRTRGAGAPTAQGPRAAHREPAGAQPSEQRTFLYTRGGIASDVVVLLLCYFPFQIYPAALAAAAAYALAVGLIELDKLLLAIAGLVALSFCLPTAYQPRYHDFNFAADPLISWHRRVSVVLPGERLPARGAGYVFAVHPHGRVFVSFSILLFFYRRWLMADEPGGARGPLLPPDTHMFFGVKLFTSLPWIRNVFGALGLVSAGRRELTSILSRGDHVALLVGGVPEVCLGTFDHKDVLYLRKRQGFLRLAMETGGGVVPVYCFGENRLFKHTSPTLLRFWRLVNRFAPVGAPFPVCGPFNLMLPFRGDLRLAFGDPLFHRRGETLDDFHARYIDAIEALFAANVGMTDNPGCALEIR